MKNIKFNINKKETVVVLFSVLLFFIVSIIFITIYNKNNKYISDISNQTYQTTLEIPGFELDKPFDLETYEYNVEVDMDEVQIICNSIEEISGCNVKIDMSNKESYDHVIEVNNNGETKKYTIHINKKISSKDEIIRISSIEGIPAEWTNNDAQIKINAQTKTGTKLMYSYDGGKTWKENNEIIVDSNKIIKIVVKDEKNNISDTKEIKIEKIDKDKPIVELMIQSKSKDKVVIKAVASDITSGVDKYSFNESAYSTVDILEVTKSGTYKVTVKDIAGNISDEVKIKIEDKDFVKEEQKQNEYKIKLESNGADIDSTILSCKSYSETCKITLPKITRSGGIVVGWSTDKDSKKAEYGSGAIIGVKKDLTLYAITSKTVTATFNKNSATSIGTTSLSCTMYNDQTSCNITMPTITRSGWTVIGWDESKSSKKSVAKAKETLKLTKNTTLYAITSKKLTATFNKNGATTIGTTSTSCEMYNDQTSCSITTPTITKSGWTIVGWNSSKDSKSASVKVKESLKLTSNKTLYAITSKNITATFNKNGATSVGTTSTSCQIYNTETDCSIKMPTISRTGGSSIGWNTDKDAKTSNLAPGTTTVLNNDITYYAITYKSVKATFEINNAKSISYTSKSCKIYNSTNACKVKPPTITPKEGWTVVGWNYAKNAEVALRETDDGITINSSGTYYAITKKTNKLTIKNGSAIINTLSCNIYAPGESCTVNFTKSPYTELAYKSYIYESNNKKYIIKSFSDTNDGTILYKPDTYNRLEVELAEDKTLYVNLIYMSNIFQKNNKTVYVQEGHYDTAKKKFDDICSWASFLCNVEGNVFVFSSENFKYRWKDGNSNAVGMTYGSVPSKVDLIATSGASGNYHDTWMHELGHAWDHYYGDMTNTYDISKQDDFMKLYNYYTKNVADTPLSTGEFFAAMVPTYVYLKNDIDASKYGFKFSYWKSFTTDSTNSALKEYMLCVFDKYVAISNNGYKISTNTKTCTFPY